ncbi:MAG TPA: serine--tRNA ligase [Clostridiales bacterium UBA8153]|nr:serine--tRNA ligase [Clostridiales bacterium UBA8153]
MLDLQYLRERPGEVREALRRLRTEAPLDAILELDAEKRELLREVETLRRRRNEDSRRVKELPVSQRAELVEESRKTSRRMAVLEERLRSVEARLLECVYQMPNLPHASVPEGEGEADNRVIRQESRLREFAFEPRPHWEIGADLGILDFQRGVKMAGTRFYVLVGAGSRLQRALIQWMLDYNVGRHGYTEVRVPYMVKEDSLLGAGQLPKFAANIYHDAEDDMWFIGTAEVPLTNLHRDEVLEAADLPKNYVAYSPCFRREKFSAGRDVRGIKRGHQFDKVEMYKFCAPSTSYAELEVLVTQAENICRALGIPHRVVEMVTGDLGFAAAKKYDVEVWAPGCGEWLEVSSCSNCEAFQARRTNTRYRPHPGARPEYVHTLNGSGLALPRTLIAVLENYQESDGTVVIPEVLRPLMGTDRIGPRR